MVAGPVQVLPIYAWSRFAPLVVCCRICRGYHPHLQWLSAKRELCVWKRVVWPILPGFLLAQAAFAAQWLLAIHGAPLWQQYSVSVVSGAMACVVAWWMLRISHPWLGDLRPIRFDYSEVPQLLSSSFWVYLLSLGNLIYLTTDRLLITAGFGAEFVPAYRNNYKACELAFLLLCNAGFVSMPGIMRRLLNGDEMQRDHGVSGVMRLQKFQVFAGCLMAAAYLCFNDIFIRLWLGRDFIVPLSWQCAFALNLVVSVGSGLGLDILVRFSQSAIRKAGIAIGLASLINLALSLAAMKAGSILGIAVATVLAQSVASITVSRHTCALLGVNWRRWLIQSWLLPIPGGREQQLVRGSFFAGRHAEFGVPGWSLSRDWPWAGAAPGPDHGTVPN